ncbi:hypothetical protein NCS52_01583000 [Fusarium sp. LHS14.1]|nr:hypothetical protein NCS52_01583000 [Fusarium sp. LHS14.1]
MPAPKKPDEETQQLVAQIIAFDTRLGQSLDSDEYREVLDVENPADAINERLDFIAKSVKYRVDESKSLSASKRFERLVEKFNTTCEKNPFKKVSLEETSSGNETMEGPKDGDWLAMVHDIGVACGSESTYPDFEGQSVISWVERYFKTHEGRPKYKDGMGILPEPSTG